MLELSSNYEGMVEKGTGTYQRTCTSYLVFPWSIEKLWSVIIQTTKIDATGGRKFTIQWRNEHQIALRACDQARCRMFASERPLEAHCLRKCWEDFLPQQDDKERFRG